MSVSNEPSKVLLSVEDLSDFEPVDSSLKTTVNAEAKKPAKKKEMTPERLELAEIDEGLKTDKTSTLTTVIDDIDTVDVASRNALGVDTVDNDKNVTFEIVKAKSVSKNNLASIPQKGTTTSIDLPDSPEIQDKNTFAAKRTATQGMMDIALLTANANQLRYLIQYQRENSTFWIQAGFIGASLGLQILVGVALVVRPRGPLKRSPKSRARRAKLDKAVLVAVFVVTVINVLVSSFSIGPDAPIAAAIVST